MALGIIVGKEISQFTDQQSGEVVKMRKLHILWDKPRRSQDGFEGQKVQVETAGFEIDDLKVGDRCNFEYEINATKKGNFAKLADVERVGHVDLDALLSKK